MSTATSIIRYQAETDKTAIYPGAGDPDSIEGLAYVALGLAGEAGEIANKVKKIIRDGGGVITGVHRAQIATELGDAFWYVARVATQLGYPLESVATANLIKLADRADRGVLQGSGDAR